MNDEIFHLPGWDSELPSRMFSGYIEAGNDTVNNVTYELYEHYMFIESENDPKKDPVLIWTNGGPGASSFFGLFVELGPFYLSSESLTTDEYKATDIPTSAHRETACEAVGVPICMSICRHHSPQRDADDADEEN